MKFLSLERGCFRSQMSLGALPEPQSDGGVFCEGSKTPKVEESRHILLQLIKLLVFWSWLGIYDN